MVKIGVIGGTGLDANVNIMKDIVRVKTVLTPFGDPSDDLVTTGKIGDVDVVIMSRHGPKHDRNPSNINYRANIWTLKQLGCTHVLVTNACGSLQENVKPGTFAIIDQYIDRTVSRIATFYKVCHIPSAHQFNRTVQSIIEESCKSVGATCRTGACIVVVEGPRYSTVAESRLYKSWGADLIGMTTFPEAALAAEAGMFYNSLALVTDYDSWHANENESVHVSLVMSRLKNLAELSQKILIETIHRIGKHDWTKELEAKAKEVKGSIMVA